MDDNRISVKQRLALVFCGLLSPLIRLVPGETSRAAGAGGWLSPLLALPVFLAVLWVLVGTVRRLPSGEGLGGLYRLAFGARLGRLLTLVTGLWVLVLSAVALRFYVESVVSSVYAETAMWLFLVGLMAVVWWACRQGAAAVCRMAQIFLPILGVTVGLIILLGLRRTHLYHVFPVWLEGWGGLLRSALPVLAVLGYGIPVLFCRNELGRAQEGGRVAALWMTGLCALMAVLGLVVLGMFGARTAVRLQMPLFSVAKEVSVLEAVERMEAVVAAVWVLSDVALIAALMNAATDYLQSGLGPYNRGLILTAGAVAVVALAAFVEPDAFRLRNLWANVLRYADAAVCYALPLTACLCARLRRQI